MSDVMEAMKKTLADIDDLLAKSSSLNKAEDKKEESEKMEKAEGDELPKEESAEQPAPEAPASPAEMPQEAAAPEAPAPEGQEGDMSQEESAEQHASSLSDEELDMMLQVLMAEKEKRSSAQAPEGQPSPEGQPEQAAPQGEEMQMSMKEDYAKMHKSMESLTAMVTDLKSEIAQSKAAPAAKPVQAKTTSKAAASNLKDVQVLEKSTPVAKRLSKSETNEFLQGQIRKKNPLVSSKNIVDLNYINSDEELHALQDELTKKGLEFPKF